MGLAHNSVAQSAGDKELDAERKDFNPDGHQETGFASSVVPTLEEKMIIEKRPPAEQVTAAPREGKLQDQTILEQQEASNHDANAGMRTDDGVLFGAPANVNSPQVDDKPPSRSGSGVDEEEQIAPTARATLRKSLNGKPGNRAWTVPTSRPDVDSQGFEDPISDAFWKNVWVASAVHNVRQNCYT